ncbi:MAG: DinB family protein [Vicinamibacterales bacterium]
MTNSPKSAITPPLSLIFAINAGLLVRALEDLSEDHYRNRPSDRTNSIAWVAGHIVQTRALLLTLLGDPFDTTWGAIFNRGAEAPEPSAYPSLDQMRAVSGDVAARLETQLAALDDAALSAPARGPQLPRAETVAQQVGFLALHDSYHVGQLGYMRKALGYPSLVG